MGSELRFPYTSPRPCQLDIADVVAKVIREGKALVLQAPTGYGKTAAVVYGLLKAGADKVLYLVRTRNELIPVIRELKNFDQKFTFLYSARRMCPLYLHSDDVTVEEFWEACRVLRVKGMCPYYEAVLQADAGDVEEVIEKKSPDVFAAVQMLARKGLCPFFALRMLVPRVRFVVATYPYFFKHEIFESVFSTLPLENLVVVVDEAHSLMDLHTTLEVKLRAKDVELALRELRKYVTEAEELVRRASSLIDFIKRLTSRMRSTSGYVRVEKNVVTNILGDYEIWDDAAFEVRVKKLEESRGEAKAMMEIAKSFTARIAEFARSLSYEYTAVYTVMERGLASLRAVPLDLEAIAGGRLSSVRAVVLMSGTMPPHSYFARAMGIVKPLGVYDLELAGRRWPPGKRFYTIVAAELTSKYAERGEYIYLKYAEYIKAVFEAAEGAVLIVYPSYEFMNSVLEYVDIPSSSMIIEDKSTEITEVRRKVIERGHVVINAVAGAKLVEGVEIVKDGRSLVESVFLAGVPYPQPDDLLKDYVDRVSKRCGISTTSVFNIVASMRARQALGRALRGEHDYAVYVLGDRRFLSKELKELMKIKIDRVVYDIHSFKRALQKGFARRGTKR